MKARLTLTQDEQERTVCQVTLERWPERADTYEVSVTYEIERPHEEDFTIEGEPYFITLLSCVRTDTNEPVSLPVGQMKEVKQAAMTKAAELNDPLV